MSDSFYQNFRLGILGGGQLGRMLIQSAVNFDVDIAILDPDENAPSRNLVSSFTHASLQDFESVYAFGKKCDVITIEIEKVNAEALKKLRDEGKKVFPQPEVIELIQNKISQKEFYDKNGIPTAPFIITKDKDAVKSQRSFLPAVHKLAKEGYDGRGVQVIHSEKDLDKAFDAPGLLEKLVAIDKEISVIVARGRQGEVKTFPPVALEFHPEYNLVEYLFAPADLDKRLESQAISIAIQIIEKLEMVGLLAVEMFVTNKGEILVNEVAPRPHNSGHHTIEANITSQFEQHLRAILGFPLGQTRLRAPAAMVNLLGEPGYTGPARYEGVKSVLEVDGAYLHLYGKKMTKTFRKMGHVTIIDDDIVSLRQKAEFVKENFKIIS